MCSMACLRGMPQRVFHSEVGVSVDWQLEKVRESCMMYASGQAEFVLSGKAGLSSLE